MSRDLARQVADQLVAKDALTTPARDELGLSEVTAARPLQAALASAAGLAGVVTATALVGVGYLRLKPGAQCVVITWGRAAR